MWFWVHTLPCRDQGWSDAFDRFGDTIEFLTSSKSRHHCCRSFEEKPLIESILFGGTDMKTLIARLGIVLTIAGMIEFGGCNSSSNDPYSSTQANNSGNNTNATPNTVVVSNMSFGPTTITVPKGTTITWKNNDGMSHTATSDTGDWDSGNIPTGGSKSVTFNSIGTFQYHCTLHPMMTATVVVQ